MDDNRHTLLVCTVGGTPDPLVKCLLNWQPARTLFVPSVQTRSHVDDIVDDLVVPVGHGPHEIVRWPEFDRGKPLLGVRRQHGQRSQLSDALGARPMGKGQRFARFTHAVDSDARDVGRRARESAHRVELSSEVREHPDGGEHRAAEFSMGVLKLAAGGSQLAEGTAFGDGHDVLMTSAARRCPSVAQLEARPDREDGGREKP